MMPKHSMIFVLGMTLLGLIGCSIRTPEIQGIVLDEKTKQPVEGAWVRATLDLKSKTIQGDVTSYLSVDSPHTRTDKHGKFLIPSKSFKKPPFPIGFGTKAINFGIGAATIDDRGGRINLKGEELEKFLGKKKVELTIYSGPVERTEAEYSSHLQSLYKYCLTGRSSVEVPPTEGGCDEWELNYTLVKHERYLEKYRGHIEKEVNTVIFDHLAYLYEKKGDLHEAIETLKKSVALIEKQGLLKFEVWQRNKKQIELKINELQKKRQEGKK
jgi:hypothetical protein